jgi:hypothetical protein
MTQQRVAYLLALRSAEAAFHETDGEVIDVAGHA